MKRCIARSAALLLAALVIEGAQAADPVRVLLVTGGHDYETNHFHALFQAMPGATVRPVSHPDAHPWFTREKASDYDVMVFYDMWQDISEEAKTNLVARLREGKGLVAMHHCLASYQKWDEYVRIIGGRYHLDKWTLNGAEQPASTYQHDVKVPVQIANRQHPVTRGLEDFVIHDETYGGFEVRPDVDVLLTTREPTSGPNLAWARRFGEARIIYLQLGHDHLAWENPAFRRFLTQAIEWTAGR